MTRGALTFILLIGLAPLAARAEKFDLSLDWRFRPGDAAGAEQPGFDDGGWRKVTVPHDGSIEDRPDGLPPFDAEAKSGQDSGYLPGMTGWYRRHLVLDAAPAGRIVRLNFEAVMMDADIWLNGRHLTRHHFGYTAFSLDLTGKVRAGDNLIAVRFDHQDPSSRWYAGSGLIRPVSLEIVDPIHIDPDSSVVTTPVASEARGVVAMRAAVENRTAHAQTLSLRTRLLSAQGELVAESRQSRRAKPKSRLDWAESLTVERPSLWSPDSPNLYTLVQEVSVGGAVKDERRLRVGLRSIAVDAREGLRINGRKFLLRGGNIHHDNYMLGAAGIPDADARKVALMKEAGYNAIRSAHNPASQATLDAADERGMLVVDEAFDSWTRSKRDQDYTRFFAADWEADIDSLVVSGRNHPSVLFWSIGNEIPEQGTALGVETGRHLAERVRRLDPTRAVTQAINNMDPPDIPGQFAQLDVAGYNYAAPLFAPDHAKFPERVMMTTESLPKDAFEYWRKVETMPWVIGDFVWTAVDYLGEAGIGWMGYSQDWKKLAPYPWSLAYCGEIDATGRKRPAAFYREVLWKTGADPISAFVRQPAGTEELPDRHLYPVRQPHLDWSLDDVHPSWTWPGQEGKPLDVVVYSEFPEIELFLNGESLGRRAVGLASDYRAEFQVPYAPGRLLAIGYRDGMPAGRWELRSAGPPSGLEVSLDRRRIRANGSDLAYLTVALTDAEGTPIYARDGDRPIQIRVSGAGSLAGMGNGDPRDAGSFQSGERRSFHGWVVAAIRAGTSAGTVEIDIAAPGLPPRRVTLNAVH